MKIAALIGISIFDFWGVTPHELGVQINAYGERCKREQEERVILAYMTAYWGRVKRMPDLNKILGEHKPKKEQTQEEMLEVIRELNAAMGGTTI